MTDEGETGCEDVNQNEVAQKGRSNNGYYEPSNISVFLNWFSATGLHNLPDDFK